MILRNFRIQTETPSSGELRSFFAKLHEPISSVTVQALAASGNVFITARTSEDGILIGVLRGSTDGREGVVHAIAVP